MCVTDRHDMTLAVKVVLNPNTSNQASKVLLNFFKSCVFLTLSQIRILDSSKLK